MNNKEYGKGKFYTYFTDKETGEINFCKGCDQNGENGVFIQPISSQTLIKEIEEHLNKEYTYIKL